jgi:hypothetical protein
MNSLTSIYIPHIDYGTDATYIYNVFEFQNLATISQITLVPYIKKIGNEHVWLQHAYIDIHEWHDNEAAYNLIQRIKNPHREAHVVHDLIDEVGWWAIEPNFKPWMSTYYPLYTTLFDVSQSTQEIVDLIQEYEFEMFLNEQQCQDKMLELHAKAQNMEFQLIEELEQYVHPVDDSLEWEELEALIRQETEQQVLEV